MNFIQVGLKGVLVGVLTAACTGTPMTLGGVTLLRFGFLTGSPTGLAQGVLRIERGCTWIEQAPAMDAPGRFVRPILWPGAAQLSQAAGELRVVLDGVTFSDGNEITIGGGEYNDRVFVESLVGPLPADCVADSYVLATKVERGHVNLE